MKMLEFWDLGNNRPIMIARDSIVMFTGATRQGSIIRYGTDDNQTVWVQEEFERITNMIKVCDNEGRKI